VSDGYFNNYLFPKKLAVAATAENMNIHKMKQKAKKAQIEKEIQQAKETAEKLKSCIVKISAKSGSSGKLFGSVTTKEISEALLEQHNISIAKQDIVQSEPIKAYGSYEVKCKLGHEITGTINVLITEEKH
jgi:large subunit ribosomal protein L9